MLVFPSLNVPSPPAVLTPSVLALTLGVHAEDKQPGPQQPPADHPPALAPAAPTTFLHIPASRRVFTGCAVLALVVRLSSRGCRGLTQPAFTIYSAKQLEITGHVYPHLLVITESFLSTRKSYGQTELLGLFNPTPSLYRQKNKRPFHVSNGSTDFPSPPHENKTKLLCVKGCPQNSPDAGIHVGNGFTFKEFKNYIHDVGR